MTVTEGNSMSCGPETVDCRVVQNIPETNMMAFVLKAPYTYCIYII